MTHLTNDDSPNADSGLTENASKKRVEMVQKYLYQGLKADFVGVDDQSHLHEGHAGATAGGSHFEVVVVSKEFEGLGKLARHRLIYQALGDAMAHDIHALSIKAYAPNEV